MNERKQKMPPACDYEVGYARPPLATRFKKRAKPADLDRIDVGAILTAPVTARR